MVQSKNGDENGDQNLVPITGTGNNHLLSRAEFAQLAEVPPEIEWFANIGNPRTRRAYMSDLRDFMGFVGIPPARGVSHRVQGPRDCLA